MRFEEFAAAEVSSLLRLARLLTGESAAAEDLVQDSLLRAFDRWELVSRADSPKAYVRRLMVNVHRAQRRRRDVGLVLVEPPDRRVITSLGWEDRDAIRQTLAALPVRQRTAVILRYYEDLDIAEVAEWMGLRPSSVRSALTRALESLRAAEKDEQNRRDRSPR